jgi:hypothetical protein
MIKLIYLKSVLWVLLSYFVFQIYANQATAGEDLEKSLLNLSMAE